VVLRELTRELGRGHRTIAVVDAMVLGVRRPLRPLDPVRELPRTPPSPTTTPGNHLRTHAIPHPGQRWSRWDPPRPGLSTVASRWRRPDITLRSPRRLRNALSHGTSSSGEHDRATIPPHTNPEDHNVVALLIAQGKEVRMDRRYPGITSATTPTYPPSHGYHHTHAPTTAVVDPGGSGWGTSRPNCCVRERKVLNALLFLRSDSSGLRGVS